MAPYKFIEKIFHGETIQQYGDGTTSRDYTYVDDIVSGIIGSIDHVLGYEVREKECYFKNEMNLMFSDSSYFMKRFSIWVMGNPVY
jgi:hypothetical protein